MRRWLPLLIGISMIVGLASPESAFTAEEDQTFLLNESQIFGAVSRGKAPYRSDALRYIEFPALSTRLPWGGVEEEDLDIPKEILDHLSQSSPSDQDSQDLNLSPTQDDIPLD